MPRILSPEEYAERYEGFRVEAAPRGALSAGLSAGADSLQSLGYGILGAGLDAVGLDSAARWSQDQRKLNDAEAYYNGRPDLDKIEGVGLDNAGEFALYQIAKQGPLIGGIAAAQMIPGVGQAATGLGLARAGAVAPRILGGGGLRAGADFATRRAALAAGEGVGSSVLAGSAVGAGSLYNQSVDAGDPSPFAAFAAAPVYGALEAAVPSALRGAFRAPANLAGGRARRMATAGAIGFPAEAATEFGQNELEMAFGPTLTDEEAFSQRLNAAAIGGLVGGGLGSLGGIRRPRTVDEGRFDLTGNGNQAPAPNTPEYNLTTEMDPLQGRINQNLGLQRTPLRGYEQQFLEAFNEPSGRFVSDPATGVERELTAGEVQQMQLGELQAQQEATTQREQQIAQETLLETSKALGVTPVATMDNTYDVLGARVYGQPQVAKLVQEVAVLNSQLPPEQQQLNAAILGANMVSFSGRTGIPTAQRIGNAINGKIKQLQLEGVESIERAAEILNDQVATLVAAGKNEGDVKLGQIATVYERLTGQTPPALGGTTAAAPAATAPVAQTQQPQFQRAPAPQGQTNVSRAATPAAPAAPSVDGRSPVVSGSVGDTGRDAAVDQGVGGDAGNPGAPAQQAALLPDADVQQPAAVEPEAQAWEDHKDDAAGPLESLPANQQEIWRMAVAAKQQGKAVNLFKVAEELGGTSAVDPRMEMLQNVFGKRNGQIVFDVVGTGMSEEEAAAKYSMSRANIQKIAGATGQKGWAGKIAIAKSKFGYTDNQLKAALTPRSSEASLGETQVESEIFGSPKGMFGGGKIDPLIAEEAGLNSIVNTAGGGKGNIGAKDLADFGRYLEPLLRKRLKLLSADQTPEVQDKLAEVEAEIAKEVKRVTELERKLQADVRKSAGKVSKKETKAAQEQRSSVKGKELDGTQADVEESGAKQAEKPVADEQVADEPVTDFEKARDAWDKEALTYDDAPTFDELTEDQQERWVEYGPKNWKAADVATELARIKKEGTYESRTTTFNSSIGPSYTAKSVNLIDLVDNQGVAQAVSLLHKQGMSHALKSVANWFTTGDSRVDWDGVFTMVNGKPSIVLNRMSMMLPEKASITVLHEVGHAIDLPGPNAVFSNSPTLGLTIQGGEVMPMRPGSVMDEVLNYYEDNGDNEALSQLLRYPFDRKEHGKLTAQQVRAEVFAQLWAFSNLQGGMQVLRDNMPATAAFMEKVHAKVKATQYAEAGGGQGNQSGQVQDRPQAGQDAYASRSSATPRIAQKEVNRLTQTLRTGADAALNKIIFSEDLFKRAAKMGLGAARDMDRIYRERAALTGNIEREVTRIENMYNRIPESAKGTGAKSANQFLYDSTRENKWGFAPTWRGKDASKVKVDPAMAARYNALPEEAQAWVSAVFEHGDKMLKTKKDTLIASTNSEYDALIADAKKRGEPNKAKSLENDKAASLKQFQRLFATNEFNPYAPMRRFGDFVVIGKSKEYLAAQTDAQRTKLESDPDHYHVSFAESRSSALELQRQLEDQGHFETVDTAAKEDPKNDMYGGLMQAFNDLRGNIESELGNATDPKEIEALRAARQTVSELYLQSLAENSARKSEMRRRGVAGEIDMLRSFSTQGRADAHFLASAKFNPQASEAVVKMRQQAKESGGNRLGRSEAFKEIMARHTQSMRYEQGGWFDVAANTTRITSIWMLATNPMYYLQNMTQPFVLSLPFMTGKHNWTDASGQLMRAYFQLGDLLKGFKSTEGFDFTKVSKDKGEQDMILKLVDRGRIDIGMDTELGQVKLEGDNIASKAANRTDRVLRSLSQKLEAVNRVSTALAAYRLEIKAGRTPAQALEYADEVISQTHGDYSRINAPRAFNTPGGKVALQFRKFQLIQLTLLTKLFYNSFANSNKAEKAAARKILAFTLAHTGVLAGVVGMPGFAAAAFIFNNLADLFGDDDEPFNTENELRKMLGGGEFARLVMRGAPTLAGADLSGKLGMGNALSILPYTDFDATREGFNAIATGLTLGATGGLGARVFQGLGDIKGGDYYRGLMGLAPIGVSQAIKAGVEAYQGETNRRGDVLVSADEISTWGTFAKAVGWPTSAVAERRFDRQVAYDNKEAFEGRSAKLKNEYTKAVRGNDSEARRAAIEKWQRLQKSRQEAGFKPQPLSILMKAPQEQAKRERNTAGGVQFNNQNRQFVQEQTAN